MPIPRYLVIDIETTTKNRGEDAIGTNKASPFHPENEMVLIGCKDGSGLRVGNSHVCYPIKDFLLVGQNIKFDMLYLYRSMSWRSWSASGVIWDTQLAEYLLTGQQSKYASLDKLAAKYGGTLKDEKIKEYWDHGIDTEDIPKKELEEYLKSDVVNTEIVFRKQYEQAEKLGMLPLIESQMEALLATIEMEWNGMHFDIEKGWEQGKEVNKQLEEAKALLITTMKKRGLIDPNPSSNDHCSLFLFGGKQKYKTSEPTHPPDHDLYRYKTGARAGEIRTRIVEKHKNIRKWIRPKPEWAASKDGFWSTSDEVLSEILKGREGRAAADLLRVYRELEKDLKTYYVGYAKLFWPNDQKIHASFNHTATNTGRLSSSKPNFQNLTKDK